MARAEDLLEQTGELDCINYRIEKDMCIAGCGDVGPGDQCPYYTQSNCTCYKPVHRPVSMFPYRAKESKGN